MLAASPCSRFRFCPTDPGDNDQDEGTCVTGKRVEHRPVSWNRNLKRSSNRWFSFSPQITAFARRRVPSILIASFAPFLALRCIHFLSSCACHQAKPSCSSSGLKIRQKFPCFPICYCRLRFGWHCGSSILVLESRARPS